MITKIKLYLAFLLFYAKQIRMRGLCDSMVLMYHVFFLVFFNNVDKHHCVKHRLNLKFLQKHIDLQSQDAPQSMPIRGNTYRIWVLWWQGEENMPHIVKATYHSIIKATDKQVVLITKDNVLDYIDIPSFIQEKVDAGKMSLAALSDYIRVSLLFNHGGLWIDSTVFCAQKLPEKIYDMKLITVKNCPSGCKYVAQGKWNVQFLGTNEVHSKVFFLMKSIFEQYWRKYSIIMDYLLVDYSFEYIYENDEECKALFDRIPLSNEHMHDLLSKMNMPFDKASMEELLLPNTYLFKLTYKMSFIDQIEGKPTFYSYVINNSR